MVIRSGIGPIDSFKNTGKRLPEKSRPPQRLRGSSLSESSGIAGSVLNAPYVASAVHFDGSSATSIICNSGSCTDSPYISASVWLKLSSFDIAEQTLLVVDPTNNYTPYLNIVSNGPGNEELGVEAYTAGFTQGMQFGNQFASFSDGNWHHFLLSGDTFTQTAQIYMDDVPQSQFDPNFINILDEAPAASIPWNGLQWVFGGDNSGNFGFTNVDVADAWIAPGVLLLDSPTTISEGTRRKFISAAGKPVNLGADGSVPTGTAPAIFFTGSAASFGTNRGTGGTFTTTGTLTDASTSPSD